MSKGAFRRVWRFLSRPDVASAIIAFVLVLAALGSCFPQLSPLVASDAQRLARWQSAAREKYGTRTDALMALGAFRFFRSPLFLASLACLILAISVCTLRRWRGVWRRAFHQPVRCSDAAFDAAPLKGSVTTGQALAVLSDIVHENLRERGFGVRTEAVGRTVHLRGDRNRLAPLGTLVLHLAVLLLLIAALLSTALAWREEVTMGPGEIARVEHVPGLMLRNDGFRIERYPDGHPAAYEAQVAIIEGAEETASGQVRLNEPLSYRGYGVYLQRYWGAKGKYSVVLRVVSDPGYVPFLVAGALLLLGLTIVLYFPHCQVHALIGDQGTLRLAGWAGRQACGFEREFNGLVAALRRAASQQ